MPWDRCAVAGGAATGGAGAMRRCSWWCMSALAVLLAPVGRADDIAIGTPVAGRGEARLDDLVGMFVNTLVLRTRSIRLTSFADLLARRRGMWICGVRPCGRSVRADRGGAQSGALAGARTRCSRWRWLFQNLGRGRSLELPALRCCVEIRPSHGAVRSAVDLSEVRRRWTRRCVGGPVLTRRICSTRRRWPSSLIDLCPCSWRCRGSVRRRWGTWMLAELQASWWLRLECRVRGWGVDVAGGVRCAGAEVGCRSRCGSVTCVDLCGVAVRSNRLARSVDCVGLWVRSVGGGGVAAVADLVVALLAVVKSGGVICRWIRRTRATVSSIGCRRFRCARLRGGVSWWGVRSCRWSMSTRWMCRRFEGSVVTGIVVAGVASNLRM